MLAGGIGSRFWPASTPRRPKQLLALGGEAPLIRETVDRALSLVPPERVRILAGAHLIDLFHPVLPELSEEAYLEEPVARGTCPVLAWAAAELVRRDPDAVMISLHADHLIHPLEAFRDTVRAAVAVAREKDALLTIGVPPSRVETGYGHIQPGTPLAVPGAPGAVEVAAFHEKPDPDIARRYTEEGYLWNSGIFVWKAAVFLDEVRRHAPEVGGLLPVLEEEGAEAFFGRTPVCVVDTAVLERSERVACVPATFSWDDVGSWASLPRVRSRDEEGNVVEGDAMVEDARDNIVWAEDGKVVLWGVSDLVVVRTGEATLVMPRERAAHLKRLLARVAGAEKEA